MDPVEDIFLNARDISEPARRAAYLNQACGGDPTIRVRVEKMLCDAAGAEAFFGKDGTLVVVPLSEQPGTTIDRYKLLQKIGEGGMGIVYMAEQREPVVRKVALKIIKLGMDTRQVIARFEAERQALALMDHPNIARVLDAGATETGRPYFVMDLVQGLPITQFCDEANLSMRQRLDLFLDVCQAVQHAHQKGIIHRDLKPSNILVTIHGDKPVPKVIDFGVAKATQGRLTDKTVFTQFQQFIGTPAYMSPEQTSLSGLDVDTRSDIYSLGVLLYELLTGKTPFDATELVNAGLEEMRRTLREKEPPRPSAKLSTLQGDELTTTAKNRHTVAPKLIHLIRGDLDWIVMKCLEKDRARRYETATALAADLQRHLGDELVLARPPSLAYTLRKAVRRNKLSFAAGTIVFVALAFAAVVSTWQAVRATRAEREAKLQTQTARGLQSAIDYDRNLYRDLWLARGYQTAGQTNAAAALMKDLYPRLAKSFPQHRDDCLGLARAFVRIEQYKDARAAYDLVRQLLDRDLPANADDFEKLIEATAGSQGWPAAAQLCHKLMDALPKEPRAWHSKAMVFLYLGDDESYRQASSNALRLAETSTNWHDFVIALQTVGRGLTALSGADATAVQALLPRLEAGTYERHDSVAGAALAAALYRLGKLDRCIDALKTTSRWQGSGYESRASSLLWALSHQRNGNQTMAYEDFMNAESAGRLFNTLTQRVEALGELENFLTDDERYYLILRREALKTIPGAMMHSLARRARWAEAAAEGARCLKLSPTNASLYATLAPVYLAQSDFDAYRQLGVRMFSQFAQTTRNTDAQLTARVCLTLPSVDVDLLVISNLVERVLRAAASAGGDNLSHCWFTKSLAEYRQENFAAATNWARQTIDYARTSGGGFEYLQARSVLAMAQFRMGQTNEARNTLIEASRLASLRSSNLRKGDLSCDWYTYIRDDVLMKEAQALIGDGK